ncbi:MAG: lipid-A-disaccharide synthase N-terminal domain-containing protein [Planctomycetota bacterium]
MARFLVQWLSSERQQRSVIPTAFWYLSLIGGGMLLTYALQRRDPVFIFGQCFGTVVYVRNLQLIHRERRKQRDAAMTAASAAAVESPPESQPEVLPFSGHQRRAA